MINRESLKIEELNILCNKFNVQELYLFGSGATGQLDRDSDLDFLVKFERDGFEGAFDQFIEFKYGLEEIYSRKIDLYALKNFRNSIFEEEVRKTKVLLYAA